jgi:hypothetical protein
MTCYNCNSPYHYSDKCPKPRQIPTCYNCGKSGHKTDRCPNPKKNNSTSHNSTCHNCGNSGHKVANCPNKVALKCYTCGETNHKATECPNKIRPKVILKNSFETKLLLKSMWSHNSALISEDCLVFKLKTKFIDQLLINNIIVIDDLDERNRTPHIDIKGDPNVFNELNGSTISISNMTIKAENNYISLEINKKYHTTLIFKLNIISVIDTVYNILDNVLEGLYIENENINKKLEDQNMLCCICVTEKKVIKISPCNHLCVCDKCINTLNSKCPMCRGKINSYEKIYL